MLTLIKNDYIPMKFEWPKHWEIVAPWWEGYDMLTLPKEALPPNGIIVYKQDVPVIAGWLYLTDSMWAIMEWIVGDPNLGKDTRRNGLDVLIPALIEVAKAFNKPIVFSSVSHPTLIEAYQRHGMMVNDRSMTNFVWRAK